MLWEAELPAAVQLLQGMAATSRHCPRRRSHQVPLQQKPHAPTALPPSLLLQRAGIPWPGHKRLFGAMLPKSPAQAPEEVQSVFELQKKEQEKQFLEAADDGLNNF